MPAGISHQPRPAGVRRASVANGTRREAGEEAACSWFEPPYIAPRPARAGLGRGEIGSRFVNAAWRRGKADAPGGHAGGDRIQRPGWHPAVLVSDVLALARCDPSIEFGAAATGSIACGARIMRGTDSAPRLKGPAHKTGGRL